MSQRPVVRGLKLCQNVIIEEGTHNYTLVNCFSVLDVSQFPSDPVQCVVHAVLSDGLGDSIRRVEVYRVADMRDVFHGDCPMRFVDRLREYRLRLRIRNLVLPSVGRYDVVLKADGEPLAHTSFHARQGRNTE